MLRSKANLRVISLSELEYYCHPASAKIQYHRCKSQNRDTGEKRLRPFVPEPDDAYKSKLKKIRKERMFMLDRKMGRDESGNACENFDIAGSVSTSSGCLFVSTKPPHQTGNIYQAQIGRSPKCESSTTSWSFVA